MAQYGYAYRTISTYNTSSSVRAGTEMGRPVAKPFAPYVPKFINNGNGYSDGYATKKKIIPVASGPDDDESDDDEGKHQRQTSPLRGKFDDFLTKVHNEASCSPPRSSHVTSPNDWRHSSQPKPYNAYADYGTNKPIGGANKHDGYNNGSSHGNHGNKEGNKPLYGGNIKNFDNHDGYGARKPIAGAINRDGYRSPIKKDNYDHGYGDYEDYNNKDGPKPKLTGNPIYSNGYGSDHGNYNNREGPKPKPTSNPIYNNGYGDDHDNYNNRKGSKPKPIGIPVYGGDYGNYEDYNNKDGPKPKPIGNPVYNNGYGGDYGNYHNKDGPKPKPNGIPVYDGDYGNHHNKEGPKPTISPVYNNAYGGHGYGDASPTQRDDYDHDNDYGNYHNNKRHGGPKPTPGWTDSPRKGTQLTKATNNIDEALDFLKKEAAIWNGNELVYNGGPKPYEYDNKAHYDGPGQLGSRPAPTPTSPYDRTMNLVNETERLKNIVTGAPKSQTQTQPQPRPSMAMKDNGNFNLAPMRQRYNFGDGRRSDYDNRRDYGIMNHKEAEKKFNGVTIDHKEPDKEKFNGMTIR